MDRVAMVLAIWALCMAGSPACAATEEDLLVFVGERLSVKQFEPKLGPDQIIMDGAFKAKFRIVQTLHGAPRGDSVEFEAYDHYGWPGFSQVANSLLFVSRVDGIYYHHKYQYYPVFRTAAGDWAGCGPVGSEEAARRQGIAEARPVAFAEPAYHPVPVEWTRGMRKRMFPRQHFKLAGDRAYCLTGVPVQDLFEVKKRTALREYGLFGGVE